MVICNEKKHINAHPPTHTLTHTPALLCHTILSAVTCRCNLWRIASCLPIWPVRLRHLDRGEVFFFLFTPSPLRLSHSCSLVLKRVKHLHLLLLQFLAGYAAGEGGRVEGGVLIFPLLARVFRRSLVTWIETYKSELSSRRFPAVWRLWGMKTSSWWC